MNNEEKWRQLQREEVNRGGGPHTIGGRMAQAITDSYRVRPPPTRLTGASTSDFRTETWSSAPASGGGGAGGGLITYLAEAGSWFVERIPPLRWLKEAGEWIVDTPRKYHWCLSAIGGFAGILFSIRSGDIGFISFAAIAGAIAGRILLSALGLVIILLAMFGGIAIVLAIVGLAIAAVIYVFNHTGNS